MISRFARIPVVYVLWVAPVLLCGYNGLESLCAQAVEFTEADKERISRLTQFGEALRGVVVDLRKSSGNPVTEGRRLSHVSELHMRFLTAASDVAENRQDGLCIFPVQVSGFTSRISTADNISNQTSGSDLQQATVTFKGLIGSPKPKVRVDLAALNHGSDFPADQTARDRIHDLVRSLFPEAEIEGIQRFFEKELLIRNETREPLRIWLFARSWDRSPDPETLKNAEAGVEQGGLQWRWLPGAPATARPLELTLAAGQSQKILFADRPLKASRVLLWAESESGERWWESRTEPLWLVEPNGGQNGERTYHAERMAMFSHIIRPQPGPRIYTERVLQMTNATPEPLEVELRYRSDSGAGFSWNTETFSIAPYETVRPRNSAGMRIRASGIQFSAESESRRYHRHAESPLWLVDEPGGMKAYMADSIGEYQYTFERAGRSSGQLATVRSSSVPIMLGSKQLGTATRDEKYEILDTEGVWAKVAFSQDGENKTGWIRKDQLSISGPQLATAPVSEKEHVQALSDRVAVMQGTTIIGQLQRGTTYRVYERKSSWLRVEIQVDGVPVQGWVRQSDVSASRRSSP